MATNYDKYFGTPEKVVARLEDIGGVCTFRAFAHVESCCDCPGDEVSCNWAILEWLQEESND